MTDPTKHGGDAKDASRDENVVGKKQLDDWLDQALANTFPASDPIASPPGEAPVGEDPDREPQP
jgi:hypothetical protein